MAIALEFIDFIVPIALIREKYPGGWEQCLKDHENLIGGRVWFDEHLLRDGAMSPDGIAALVDEWTELGFEPTEERDGQQVWKECCVVESLYGRPTLPCDWLEIGEDGCTAYLKGTEPGEVASRPGWCRPL
ncbi:hypothetical protein [Nitrosospira multiformis]|uniref:Uncharacterized protein n=1 Tax=Nitrosospira multiformis TaxID=1231 RepID=A0A1I7IKV0_9PROT|nr:hypothetical protein [Nitrosospira multiformis]SFU73542.1 hypothetical protein SAMN05216417_1218 [Nitrosospira multiformis]